SGRRPGLQGAQRGHGQEPRHVAGGLFRDRQCSAVHHRRDGGSRAGRPDRASAVQGADLHLRHRRNPDDVLRGGARRHPGRPVPRGRATLHGQRRVVANPHEQGRQAGEVPDAPPRLSRAPGSHPEARARMNDAGRYRLFRWLIVWAAGVLLVWWSFTGDRVLPLGAAEVGLAPRLRSEVVATGIPSPAQLAFSTSGSLIVLSHGWRGDSAAEIFWLDPAAPQPVNASLTPRVVIPFADGPRKAVLGSLAVDPKTGDLFLGEENGNRIYRLTSDQRLVPVAVGLNQLLRRSPISPGAPASPWTDKAGSRCWTTRASKASSARSRRRRRPWSRWPPRTTWGHWSSVSIPTRTCRCRDDWS